MSTITTQEINKTAKEMKDLIKKSKRKLLELEIAISQSEIEQNKFDIFDKAEDLIKQVKK